MSEVTWEQHKKELNRLWNFEERYGRRPTYLEMKFITRQTIKLRKIRLKRLLKRFSNDEAIVLIAKADIQRDKYFLNDLRKIKDKSKTFKFEEMYPHKK